MAGKKKSLLKLIRRSDESPDPSPGDKNDGKTVRVRTYQRNDEALTVLSAGVDCPRLDGRPQGFTGDSGVMRWRLASHREFPKPLRSAVFFNNYDARGTKCTKLPKGLLMGPPHR
jgi:hypothetical protein